ncbi:COMM domain containing 4 [Pelomyxa schiedti]|nr:COMM domain containing 4 [Pelomyxa schiedti]
MRFRFCGDLDAPDWLLRECDVVSRMTYVRIKLLAMHIISAMLGTIDQLDYDKVHKLVSTANFEESDVRAVIAALRFIIHSAAKNDVEPQTLAIELGQLGFPNEHTLALQRAYGPQREKLRQVLAEQTLSSLPHIEPTTSPSQLVDWRVDFVMASGRLATVAQPSVHLCFNVNTQTQQPHRIGDKLSASAAATTPSAKQYAFELSADKFRVLHHELRNLLETMDSLQKTSGSS